MFDSVNAFAIYILIPDVTLKNAECKDCNLKKIKTHITWYKSNQKVLGLVVAWHLGVFIPEKRLYVSHIKHINEVQFNGCDNLIYSIISCTYLLSELWQYNELFLTHRTSICTRKTWPGKLLEYAVSCE